MFTIDLLLTQMWKLLTLLFSLGSEDQNSWIHSSKFMIIKLPQIQSNHNWTTCLLHRIYFLGNGFFLGVCCISIARGLSSYMVWLNCRYRHFCKFSSVWETETFLWHGSHNSIPKNRNRYFAVSGNKRSYL